MALFVFNFFKVYNFTFRNYLTFAKLRFAFEEKLFFLPPEFYV